jgi:hypothetical protein
MKNPLLISLIFILLFTPVNAVDNDLFITSHNIKIHHHIRGEGDERKTFYYDISEIMEIKNTGNQNYDETLEFFTQISDDDTDEMKVEITQNKEKKNCEFSLKDGKVMIEFKEENIPYINPEEIIQVSLNYRVYFLRDDYTKPDVWTKEILYPHEKQSFQVKVNPVGSAGYVFDSDSFTFYKSPKESGWYESLYLSPEVGKKYIISSYRSEKEYPKKEEKETLQEEEISIDTDYEDIMKQKVSENTVSSSIKYAFYFLIIMLICILSLFLVGLIIFKISNKLKK